MIKISEIFKQYKQAQATPKGSIPFLTTKMNKEVKIRVEKK